MSNVGVFARGPVSAVSSYIRRSISVALNTIVAPASNVRGIWVLSAWAASAGAAEVTRIMHQSSAPASIDDTNAVTLVYVGGGGGTGFVPNGGVALPYFLPAGQGLYEQSAAGGASSFVAVSYTVL